MPRMTDDEQYDAHVWDLMAHAKQHDDHVWALFKERMRPVYSRHSRLKHSVTDRGAYEYLLREAAYAQREIWGYSFICPR
jgi:hypothetical protein